MDTLRRLRNFWIFRSTGRGQQQCQHCEPIGRGRWGVHRQRGYDPRVHIGRGNLYFVCEEKVQ